MIDYGTVDDGSDDGVQARAVTAGSEDTKTHGSENLCNVDVLPDHAVRWDAATLPAYPVRAERPVRLVDTPAQLSGAPVRRGL
ncbi:hypothetical protein ACFWIA_22695, partial [Streptomyces sp. NPDC127068]|uniref:hypothetical protein n=1 Tax=Streptomyces sp. NPDC127068 TaxID=3347127 RepID=UPI0036557356